MSGSTSTATTTTTTIPTPSSSDFAGILSTALAQAGVAGQTGPTPYQQRLNDLFNLSPSMAESPVRLYNYPKVDPSSDASGVNAPGVTTLRDAVNSLYSLDAPTLTNLQTRMEAAGLYGSKKPHIGVADEDTLVAFRSLLTTTAGYGDSKSADDVLNSMISTATQSGIHAARTNRGGNIVVDDPAYLRSLGDKVGTALLGRRLTSDEQAKIVAEIQGAERSNATAAASTNTDGGTYSGTDVNPEARITEAVRAANPTEAEATSMVDQFKVLQSMLSGKAGG